MVKKYSKLKSVINERKLGGISIFSFFYSLIPFYIKYNVLPNPITIMCNYLLVLSCNTIIILPCYL